MEKTYEKFLRYIAIDTHSIANQNTFPSNRSQFTLAKMLYDELLIMGISDICMDEKSFLYATIPANTLEKIPTIGFCAHLDTASGINGVANPRVIYNYNGEDVLVNEDKKMYMTVEEFPFLKEKIGDDLIISDGFSVLGADDKAGIAQIMRLAEYLSRSKKPHGEIKICFTPDQETGQSADYLNYDLFNCDYAFTVDSGAIGDVSFENFNAASCEVLIQGKNIHPGIAKDKMVNAILVAMEFNSMLPHSLIPENTQGYEGFNHVFDMSGEVDHAKMQYIIRNYEEDEFEKQKKLFYSIANLLNEKYGFEVAHVNIVDTYSNMKNLILENPQVIKIAEKALDDLNIDIKYIPFRGGTDGARMSFKGILCPNLGNGGYNSHSYVECITIQDLKLGFEVLRKIVEENASYNDWR